MAKIKDIAKKTAQQQQQNNEEQKVYVKEWEASKQWAMENYLPTEKGGEPLEDEDENGNTRVIGNYWVDKAGVLRVTIGKGANVKHNVTTEDFLNACSVLFDLGFKGAIELVDATKDNALGEGHSAIRAWRGGNFSKK